uniref:Mediator of RNA polymerase II transcription subunit 5 n=1 Tax=Phaeosphaeria nodorum (strain SN15 / ATCC MYA-4574 / FGSC 10173) TaxID=321614 RepID=MED5_PHANO|nr:RecName: Full=Mediator of RNA polymerase II transcription subunit 5; AltName: Full=Mediator complex subunit 5 [Parastagonospora nodorum SN15]
MCVPAKQGTLHAKSPLPGLKIAGLLLRPRAANASSVDPRVIIYLERLLALKKVDASDVLSSAFQYSKDRLPKTGDDGSSKDSGWHNPPELEEVVFHRLSKAFQAEERPVNSTEGLRTLVVVTRWMQTMVTSHTSDTMIQAMAGIQQQPQQQSINVREGLGMLVVGVIENQKMLNILNKHHIKNCKSPGRSRKSNTTFTTNLATGEWRSERRSRTETQDLKSLRSNFEAVDWIFPTINTRAGLYIFLNSLIDSQNMATDLITAAFDILANAMYRSEPSQNMFCLKSFLINKIPILLLQISSSMFPMTAELSITQALSHVDPNAFPAFSQGFDDMLGNTNSLADVRQDFLNACALHGLITTATVERLLGETPMQGPPGTKYDKSTLLEQCKSNFDKISMYIDELDNLDGNAGAIVGAIAEFIPHLCETQMTMYLKQLSSLLFKKPQAIDVILQFTSPASILRPLCQILDDWHYDSDQGEYQPVYDEFGAVLVLVMTFMYRYDLTYHDIGIGAESFVARLMTKGNQSMLPDEMTDEQSKHLGHWLKGLYDAGNEGLSNDVFASCSPREFYFIVPTLFKQTVMALSAGILTFESVKGGLEYLMETFLLPSLIGGLIWMSSYALIQSHSDLDAIMRIFREVISSAPSSGDAQAMHSTILSIVSSRLEKCLRTIQRRDASRANSIEPLIQAIKGNLHSERSMFASMKELEQWTNAPNSTLHTSLRHTVQQLSQWASTSSIQPNPPSYTHRQVYVSLKIMGASKVIKAIVDELKAQTEASNGAAALDVGVSIICAPTVDDSPVPVAWLSSPIPASNPPRTRLNLREMLKHEFDNAAALVATDPLAAETVVRLHRRVEAQLSSIAENALQGHGSVLNLPNVNMGDMQSQSIPDDITKAIDDAAAASIADDITTMDNKALQRSMDDLTGPDGLDLSSIGMGTGDAGTGDMGAELGNLPDLDLGDMSGMGMDMDMDMAMGGGGDDDWGLDFDNM